MDSKVCSKCGIAKPLEQFSICRKSTGLRRPGCKECEAAARRLSPDEHERRYRAKMLRRFWGYANRRDDGECWLWSGDIDMGGYGVMHLPGRARVKAHRFSWELNRGPIPESLFVLHDCDVRRCVNPSHLYLGTQSDNMRDMVRRARGGIGANMKRAPDRRAFGERIARAKLSREEVEETRRLFRAGVKCAEIARRYGVSRQAIDSIVKGKTRTRG